MEAGEVDHSELRINIAVCLFFLGDYLAARDELEASPALSNPLWRRLSIHVALKTGREPEEGLLGEDPRDRLCLAALHFLKQRFQEAIDIYKRLLVDNKDFLALNVYIALCYHKLDYFDVSQEVLREYLARHPESVIARNLKACNHFRLFNGRAAEQELRDLIDSLAPSFSFAKDLIRHNLCVFRGGEGALQVMPPLLHVLPEARLNLMIFYLRNGESISSFLFAT